MITGLGVETNDLSWIAAVLPVILTFVESQDEISIHCDIAVNKSNKPRRAVLSWAYLARS